MIMGKLVALLAEHLDMEVSEITEDTTFEALGIDSLDTVELVMQLEEEVGVELELDEKITTVGELATFVQKKLG